LRSRGTDKGRGMERDMKGMERGRGDREERGRRQGMEGRK